MPRLTLAGADHREQPPEPPPGRACRVGPPKGFLACRRVRAARSGWKLGSNDGNPLERLSERAHSLSMPEFPSGWVPAGGSQQVGPGKWVPAGGSQHVGRVGWVPANGSRWAGRGGRVAADGRDRRQAPPAGLRRARGASERCAAAERAGARQSAAHSVQPHHRVPHGSQRHTARSPTTESRTAATARSRSSSVVDSDRVNRTAV